MKAKNLYGFNIKNQHKDYKLIGKKGGIYKSYVEWEQSIKELQCFNGETNRKNFNAYLNQKKRSIEQVSKMMKNISQLCILMLPFIALVISVVTTNYQNLNTLLKESDELNLEWYEHNFNNGNYDDEYFSDLELSEKERMDFLDRKILIDKGDNLKDLISGNKELINVNYICLYLYTGVLIIGLVIAYFANIYNVEKVMFYEDVMRLLIE
mgnify:CR=1 FL=1